MLIIGLCASMIMIVRIKSLSVVLLIRLITHYLQAKYLKYVDHHLLSKYKKAHLKIGLLHVHLKIIILPPSQLMLIHIKVRSYNLIFGINFWVLYKEAFYSLVILLGVLVKCSTMTTER